MRSAGDPKRVVVIAGEDAAPEAMRPTLALLARLGLPIEWIHPPVADHEATRRAIDASAATLFGATSGPSARALFHLRWAGRRTPTCVPPAGGPATEAPSPGRTASIS